jgi:hypothetical protein
MRCSLLAVVFALLFPLSVDAEEPGDPLAGLSFARAHCAECHAVTELEEKSPNPTAPTFGSVAKTSGMTGRALAGLASNITSDNAQFCRCRKRSRRRDCIHYELATASGILTLQSFCPSSKLKESGHTCRSLLPFCDSKPNAVA